jgi:hypothetical protein
MSFGARAEIEINKPIEVVKQFVFEPTNEPYWIRGVIESHMLSVRPVGRGTQVQQIRKFMGRTIEYVYEMTEYDPAGHIKMISLNGPVSMEVEYFVEKSHDNKTIFRQSVIGIFSGYYRIINFLASGVMRKDLNKDMAHLKGILER